MVLKTLDFCYFILLFDIKTNAAYMKNEVKIFWTVALNYIPNFQIKQLKQLKHICTDVSKLNISIDMTIFIRFD